MYYILFYKTVDNYVEKRAPHREQHLKYANEFYKRGELIMAGALEEPVDTAVLVFKGDSPEIADNFALNDPYVRNSLITEWTIRPWNVAIGGEKID